MPEIEEVLAANEKYVESFGYRANLDGKPSERLAVLTCMDARIEPKQVLGLKLGDANIIRNAGARVTEGTMRSLIASTKMLGVDTIFILHHTNCGMAQRTDEEVIAHVSEGVEGGEEIAEEIDWSSIISEPEALIEDVHNVRANPLISSDIPIYGMLMDIETGAIIEVQEAIDLGTSQQVAD